SLPAPLREKTVWSAPRRANGSRCPAGCGRTPRPPLSVPRACRGGWRSPHRSPSCPDARDRAGRSRAVPPGSAGSAPPGVRRVHGALRPWSYCATAEQRVLVSGYQPHAWGVSFPQPASPLRLSPLVTVLALRGGEDIHAFAIFCHRTACDGHVVTRQHLGDFLVTQRPGRVFAVDQFADAFLDTLRRHVLSLRPSEAGGEELLQRVDP